MELMHGPKPNQSTIELPNFTEARLFAAEGLGVCSFKGVRLVLQSLESQGSDKWPIVVTVSNRRLEHVADRMHETAAKLGAMQTLSGFGEYPEAVEREFALREMVSEITQHLVDAAPFHD